MPVAIKGEHLHTEVGYDCNALSVVGEESDAEEQSSALITHRKKNALAKKLGAHKQLP